LVKCGKQESGIIVYVNENTLNAVLNANQKLVPISEFTTYSG
jgi:hypothetical protein